MTLEEIYERAQALDADERKTLVKMLVDSFDPIPRHKLTELRGLGAEIWQEIDTAQYINDLRDEWDKQG